MFGKARILLVLLAACALQNAACFSLARRAAPALQRRAAASLSPCARGRAGLGATALGAALAAPTTRADDGKGTVRRVAAKTALTVGIWSLLRVAAFAAGGEDKLHVGQKLALWLQGTGLPKEAILMIISALPVVELRGGVPVGIWMGMPVAKTAALAVVGNMMPILPLLFALKQPLVRKIMKPILDRAQSKAAAFGDEDSRVKGLALFVGIPLPGTGAWTGAMGAFLLGMPLGTAMGAIFTGVVLAACIMSLVTVSGTIGGVVASAFLAAAFFAQARGKK